MTLALPARVKLSDHVLFQELAGECVLLDMEAAKYYSLDEIGAHMWRLLLEHEDPERVLPELTSYYAADEATLRHDLTVFIDTLQQARLVTLPD